MAAELAERANRDALTAAMDAVPALAGAVCDDFDKALEQFGRLLQTAPRGVSSQMTGDQFEAHAELLQAVEAMTSAAMDRGRLALLTGEGEDIGADGIWLVLDPKGTATLFQVREALAEGRSNGFPNTIEGWERLASLGVRMARSGDVARRR